VIAGGGAVTGGAVLVTGYSVGRAVEIAFGAAAAAYEVYIVLQSLELPCLHPAVT